MEKSKFYFNTFMQSDTKSHIATLMRCLVRFAATDEGSNINCTRIIDLLMH